MAPRELKRGMIVLGYYRLESERRAFEAAARVAERNSRYGLGRIRDLRFDQISVALLLERGLARGGNYMLDGKFLVAGERLLKPSLS